MSILGRLSDVPVPRKIHGFEIRPPRFGRDIVLRFCAEGDVTES